MKCEFVVGQRVVCIHEGPWQSMITNMPSTRSGLPVKGGIYKITHIFAEGPFVFLRLDGIDHNTFFVSYCFRPLQDKPKHTSIEQFKKLLAPTKKTLERV